MSCPGKTSNSPLVPLLAMAVEQSVCVDTEELPTLESEAWLLPHLVPAWVPEWRARVRGLYLGSLFWK